MIIIPAMNIHFERIYTSFGVKCYAMRSLRINKKNSNTTLHAVSVQSSATKCKH